MPDRPTVRGGAEPGPHVPGGPDWARPPEPAPGDLAERSILHVDMDAFFASVEVLDDPSLSGLPVIVGGSGPRGVVAACTYEARQFGVQSVLPSAVARRLCPDAVFVAGRFDRYAEESGKLHAIFESITPLVEGIALDEAFLDVTGCRQLHGPPRAIAASIRRRVADELHLSCSVGIGRSKLIAKLASKAAKPVATRAGIAEGTGIAEVPFREEVDFLHPLPVRALWGVGPATGRTLDSLGLTTVGDLASLPAETLQRLLGQAQGAHLSELARGHDPRPVVSDHRPKSIGHEETFAADLHDRRQLQERLVRMVDAASGSLRRADLAARTVTVKIRFSDFSLLTRSHTLPAAVDAGPAIGTLAAALVDSVDLDLGVRLLGVSLSGLTPAKRAVQLSLDLGDDGQVGRVGAGGAGCDGPDGDDRDPGSGLGRAHAEAERTQGSWVSLTAAMDEIRDRYGSSSIGPASLVGTDGLRVKVRGEAQWGPSEGVRAKGPGPGESRPGYVR